MEKLKSVEQVFWDALNLIPCICEECIFYMGSYKREFINSTSWAYKFRGWKGGRKREEREGFYFLMEPGGGKTRKEVGDLVSEIPLFKRLFNPH